MRGEACGPGRRSARTAGEREGASGRGEAKKTVHAAWWSRPRLSGSTRGRSRDRGPTPVDQHSCCAPPGKPAGRRGIRGTPIERRSETNTLRDVRSVRRSEPVRREPTAPHRVGTAVWRVPRLGAIVLENKIRELQTSVEWTGVAAGPLPREPGSPSRRAGRPERGGVLAHRALHTSDVVRMSARSDRAGTRSTHQDHSLAGSEAGTKRRNDRANDRRERFSQARRDRYDERRLDQHDSGATPSQERCSGRGSSMVGHVRDVLSRAERSLQQWKRSGARAEGPELDGFRRGATAL